MESVECKLTLLLWLTDDIMRTFSCGVHAKLGEDILFEWSVIVIKHISSCSCRIWVKKRMERRSWNKVLRGAPHPFSHLNTRRYE